MKNKNISKQDLGIDQLSVYREQCKLSVEEIANNIKVSQDVIHKIESGDFENIGAQTYVRGHLRNYCKQLDLDPAFILSQLPSNLNVDPAIQRAENILPSSVSRVRLQSNYIGKYAVGTILLAALVGSFYVVWDKWNSADLDPDGFGLVANTQEQTEQSDTNKTVSNTPQHTYSSLIPQVQDTEANTDKAPSSDSFDENQEPIEGDANAIDAALLKSLESESIPSLAYKIELNLSEEAWVSIKSNNGEVIEADLIQPGLKVYQSDEALQFRIGNADSLELKINDEIIDLKGMTEKNVADFSWPIEQG